MSDAAKADITQLETLLASAARRRDRAAFDELVRRSARLVWATLYLSVCDRNRADELTQETYLSAWQAITSLADPARFRPWLMAIARSVVTDDVRRRGRFKRSADVAGDAALAGVAGDAPDPSASAETAEQQRRVLDALAALPQQYQEVLALRFLAGADNPQIEKQLALTNGSLRGLLHRGLEMLRAKLGDQ